MAAPSLTYTLSNGTTADASQVMQNFNDLLNGYTDGTKDLSISALTCAGTATLNGHVNLGNSSADDLTITASLASSIAIKTTNSYNIGSATLGLASIYFGANSQTVRLLPSASMSATWTLTLPVSAGTANYTLITDGSGVSSWSKWDNSAWYATGTVAGTLSATTQTIGGAKTFTSSMTIDTSATAAADGSMTHKPGSGSGTQTGIISEIAAGDDSGTTAVMRFDSRRSSGAAVTARNLFAFLNYGTENLSCNKDGVWTFAENLKAPAVHSDLGGTADTDVTVNQIRSGRYTPTSASVANLDSAPTVGANSMNWIQVGQIVFCTGRVTVDPTAAAPTTTQFTLTVPVTPTNTFGAVQDATGVACFQPTTGTSYEPGFINAKTAARTVQIDFAATNTASGRELTYSFSYKLV